MATTTTSYTNLPDYIQKPTQSAIEGVDDFLSSPDNYVYGSKPGESLFTPLSDLQMEAVGNVDWLADQDIDSMFNLGESQDLWRDFAGSGPALVRGDFSGAPSVSTERVVDENGWLGSMDDYMDPYIGQVLDNQIRRMNEQGDRDRRTLGASANMTGSFGDARHGVMESMMADDRTRSVMDATARTYSDAFNTAMGMRGNDIARRDGLEQFNAGLINSGMDRGLTQALNNQRAEQVATDNLGTAAQALEGVGQTRYDLFTDINDSLFNAGNVMRGESEEQRQAIQDFQEAVSGQRYEDALRLLGAIQGVPYETSQTQTQQTRSDSGVWGLAGSLLSGLFG